MRRLLTAAGTVLAVTAAGGACGGDEEPGGSAARAAPVAGEPETLVRTYFAALGRGDGARACRLMTDSAQRGMRQLPQGEAPRSCERAVAVLARDAVPVRRAKLRDLRIFGDSATARVTSDDPPYDSGVLLRRDEGGWKLGYPPAVTSKFDTPPGIRPHEDKGEAHR